MNDATLRIASLPWWEACPSLANTYTPPYRPFLSRSSFIFLNGEMPWEVKSLKLYFRLSQDLLHGSPWLVQKSHSPLVILEDSIESCYFKTKFASSLIDCASGLRKKKESTLNNSSLSVTSPSQPHSTPPPLFDRFPWCFPSSHLYSWDGRDK